MTDTINRSLLKISLILFSVIIVLMPLHPFLSTWLGTSIGPLLLWKSWKEILFVSILLLITVWLWKYEKKQKITTFISNPLIILIVIYIVFSAFVSALHIYRVGPEATLAGAAMGFRYFTIFIIGYALFYFMARSKGGWMITALKFLSWTGVILALLGVIQVFFLPKMFLAHFGYDALFTIPPFLMVDDNPNVLRAFATLRGPNDYGAYLILTFLATLVLFRQHTKLYGISGILIVVGIFLSNSRSAWIGLLVSCIVAGVIYAGRHVLRNKKVIISSILGVIVGISLVIVSFSVPAVRLAIFHSSPSDPHLFEGSTSNHFMATQAGIERVMDNPLGCGLGCAGPASYYSSSPKISENYFVQVGEETGIIGLTLWLIIQGSVFVMLYRSYLTFRNPLALVLLASGIGISVIGLLLHVWSDDPLSLTWWGLAGGYLGWIMNLKEKQKRVGGKTV